MVEHSTVATSAVRPDEPAGQVIATFDNYPDAEPSVDYLSDRGFEVNRVAIVGRDLEYVEQVLGRLRPDLRCHRRRPDRPADARAAWWSPRFPLRKRTAAQVLRRRRRL